MSPRAYKSTSRHATAEATRQRIVAAARDLLQGGSAAEFTVDAVARTADVSRQTVYNAFGSKSGLLEALCDSLAATGRMERLAEAFTQPTLPAALEQMIATFCRFWDSDRLVTRRLRGLAALDPDLAQVLNARDQRRHTALHALLTRRGGAAGPVPDATIDVLWALTSFETFDALATEPRGAEEVAALLLGAASTLLGLQNPGPSPKG